MFWVVTQFSIPENAPDLLYSEYSYPLNGRHKIRNYELLGETDFKKS